MTTECNMESQMRFWDRKDIALAWGDSVVGVLSCSQKVVGSIPGQGTYPACRFDPLQGMYRRRSMFLSHIFVSFFLSLPLSLSLKAKKKKVLIWINYGFVSILVHLLCTHLKEGGLFQDGSTPAQLAVQHHVNLCPIHSVLHSPNIHLSDPNCEKPWSRR